MKKSTIFRNIGQSNMYSFHNLFKKRGEEQGSKSPFSLLSEPISPSSLLSPLFLPPPNFFWRFLPPPYSVTPPSKMSREILLFYVFLLFYYCYCYFILFFAHWTTHRHNSKQLLSIRLFLQNTFSNLSSLGLNSE